MAHGAASRLRDLAMLVLVACAVFAAAKAFYAGQTLARGPDQADMLLAFFNDASHAIAEEGPLAAMYGERVRAGESQWSNPNYHVLYPLYLNWAGADASPAATLDRLHLIVFLHLALLAAGGAALARALGAPLAVAAVAGLLLPWWPPVRSAAAWPHIIAGMAWIPWLLAAQVRLQAPGSTVLRLAMAAVLAASATLLVYAHPAQNLVFAAIASGLLWLLPAAALVLARDHAGLRTLATGAGFTALAAVATFVATWNYLSEILAFHAISIRWLGEIGGFVVGDQQVPPEALRHHAFPAGDAGAVLAFAIRRGIGHPYIGAAVLLAASLVAARWMSPSPQTRSSRALLVVGVLALLACFAPAAPVLAAIPLAGKVRELSWWSCLAVVVLVPLAAVGLDALRRRAPPAWMRDGWVAATVLAALFATTAILIAGAPHAAQSVSAMLLSLAVLAACLRAGARLRHAWLACAAMLAAAAWMPLLHNLRFARGDAMLFHADRQQAHADAAALARRLPERGDYRLQLVDGIPDAHLLTHAWTMHGFRAIHGGIGPDDHAKYRLLHEGGPVVRALYGQRWTLLPGDDTADGDTRLRPGLALRTDPSALPRLYFLAGGIAVVADPARAWRDAPGTSPLRALLTADALPAGLATGGTGTLGTLEVEASRRTRLVATVDATRPGLVILNEDPRGRWRATVDGRPAAMFPVNGYQTAVAVTAPGRHRITITRPARLSGDD